MMIGKLVGSFLEGVGIVLFLLPVWGIVMGIYAYMLIKTRTLPFQLSDDELFERAFLGRRHNG